MSRVVVRGYKTELDLNNQQKTACLKHAGRPAGPTTGVSLAISRNTKPGERRQRP